MTSGGYTYTNDLDDGGVAAVVARRREQSNSPLAQLVAELGGSQSHYDYLDNSLSAGFETDFGEVHPAVALEDFVGVEVSVLQSGSFESNSVFDLGAEEEGTQTPSGGSQQSTASGTDFDTLPIAPMAKRPIEAPAQARPAVVSSLTKRASVSSGYRGAAVGAAGVPPLTSAFAGATDGKGLATPFKYLDLYGLPGPSTAADSATSHPQPHPNASSSIYNQASMSAAKQGNSVNEGGLSATTRRTSTKSGGGEPASGGAGRLSKTSSGLANGGRAAPPAPPALPPGSVQSKAEREGFGFGIDTLLHGNQLGFGRQPSFKRIAPAAGTLAANSANKPYYLIPGMEADGANATLIDGGAAGAGAGNAVASNRPPLPSAGPSARPSAVHDRNAEAFSTWLDTLDPNANSVSHRSTRVAGGGASVSIGPHGAGPSVGEDFKREVDVLMRDLLGDYDLVSGATWAFGANASVTSGGAAPGAGATQSARRGSLSVAGARETVRQLEYDAFVTDVRMLTPTINSPVAGDGESKPAAQPSRPARAAGAPAAPTTPSEDGGRRPGAAARIAQFGSGAAQSPKQQQQQQTSSPLSGAMGSGAQPRRRRTWGDGASAARSDGISGAALDPSTEAQTMDSPRPATRRASGAAPPHQHPAPAGPRPVAAARVPRAGTGVAAAGAGGHVASPPTVKPATPGRVTVQRPESVSELRLQQCPPPDSFEDMDEDLLAGGYMTRPTVLRSNESLFDSKGPYRMEEGATLGISPSSPPKDGARGGAGAAAGSTHGRRFSSVEGNAGASLMRQKWHPQGKKSSAASASADHANFAAAARPSALSPGTVSADPAKRLGHLAADAGPYPSVLLMPTFPTNGTSPMRRDSMHRGTSILTMESVSKASRRTSASPSTIEPILLVDRERPGFLQRVSTRNSEVRDDTVDFGAALSATVQPRRRLDEFRGGGVDGPAASSAASGAGGPKEAAAEAERARAREREVQQANEERRQRIQAFMAKRKAEKLQEESRRSQLVERDRKLEAFREQQERQRIQEATAPDGGVPGAAAAGSGLNAIKATQRQRKPVLDRPQRHSVATASLIPTASTVPMSPAQPPGESDAAARPAAGARSRATHSPASTTAAGKPKVRAVVVFISNRSSGGGDGDRAAAQRNAEQRPLDTNAAGVYEGTSVVMERQEEERMLRVLQPQDRPRSFAVDEFVPITDIGGVAAASSKSSEHSATTASRNTPFSLRGNAGAPRRRLTSLTLTEMSRKFLAGVNVALLLASTAGAQDASVLAIREVVEGVVLHMPAQSQLFASIANVVSGNTQDLLVASSRTARSTFASSPLFGPTLDDVSCVQVTGVGQLLRLVADAYKQAKVGCRSESGLLVISLLLKQCRSDGDVILSSYLITDAGCDASQYTAVLRKSQHAPCALFLSALGGPSLTTALMSADAEDTTSVVPLLNVQHRLASVLNKPCHVGSVRRFMELAQRELESSDGRASKSGSMVVRPNSSNSTSNSKLSTSARQQLTVPRSQIHKRLVEQVAMAQRILDDPQSFVPKSLPPAETDLVATPTTVASAPSTAPPSSTAASRVRLTSKQEAEVTGLRLSSAAAPKRSTHDALPSAATTAATAPVPGRALPSTSGVALLPSLAPTAYKTRPGSSMSAAPLKHQPSVTSSADAAAAVPPARRPSNSSTSAAQESEAAGAATRPSFRSFRTATATPAAPPTGSSGRPLSSNEKSVSVSIEYVRRGDGTGSGAPRNTGFMNFEDVTASQQSMPPSARGAGTASQNAALLSGPGSERVVLPPRPATTMVPSSGSLTAAAGLGSGDAAQRRVSADEARRGSGMQPFAPPSLDVGGKRLLPGATTMGANGPQWPSAPALEIPTIQSVASMDTSFGHDVSTSMRQSSTVYGGERPPIPASTKVRTLVIVDSRCRETSNVTYDNTMVIATTEDDFEEYDVDEVREATPGQTEPIQAELLTELCDTLMLGCNAAILGADSRPTGFSAQALKSVVHAVFAEMDRPETHRSGRLSASIVKVKGESVVDLLKDDGEAQKLVIAISPLFGSCVHGVTYAEVASGAAFSDMMDAALGRAAADDKGRDYGFLFCSLLIKLRLEEESDVQVCSLVATFAGENVGLYTSVLDRSPLVPRALFHYALGGPSYTIALLGIGSDETRANQMLQVQKRLGEMSNRATHPGSVAKFVTGIRNDLTPNLIAKYESSREPMERAATKEMLERLAEMVRDADALLVDFDHHQPKAYLHGDPDQGGEGTNDSNKQQQRLSPPSVPPSTMSRDSADRCKNVASNDVSLSMQHSGTSPARPPPGTQRALPSITAVNPEADGERIQALVCFEQVMMGAGTVAVQGNTVFCASQGGTRFDSDEVITCDESHRNLSSTLMDELVRKFLAGHHTGLLAADSSYSAFTPLMLRHIANSILEAVLGSSGGSGADGDNGFALSTPPSINGELQVSIALIKDDVTADLLPIDVDATYHRFEMEHTPLYGPRVVGVTPHLVAHPHDFDHFLAVAIDNADPALQTADPGIMVVSLVLTQRVTKPVEDVLVSSLLCTAVFDAVHHYERVLEGNTSEPLDLFKNVLRGQCFSVALLGISDEEEDPGKLLRALNDLSQVRNRPSQVNSVSRHIRELQRGIVKLKERMTTSSNADEKAYIQSRVGVAEKLLEEAESLQRNPLTALQPHAFVPLGGTPDLRS